MAMKSSRERLVDMKRRNPNLTATEAAAHLGLSRQRVHQLCSAEGIVLRDARVRAGFDSPHVESPKSVTGRYPTPKALGCASELRVAVDLLDRGLDVYRSLTTGGLCDLVIVNRRTEKVLRIEVKTSQRSPNGKPVHGAARSNKFDVLARVYRDGSVEYEPDIITGFSLE